MSGSGWQHPGQHGRPPEPPRRGFPAWAVWVLIVGGVVVVAASVVVTSALWQFVL